MQFSYTEDGWVMYFIVPRRLLPLLPFFCFLKKLRHFCCWLGELGSPRNNVLETIETSGIETIQIYLESPGGALCNVLSYVFTRNVILFSIVTEE